VQTNIQAQGFRSLREGERVEFEIARGQDGRTRAVNVTGPDGAEPQVLYLYFRWKLKQHALRESPEDGMAGDTEATVEDMVEVVMGDTGEGIEKAGMTMKVTDCVKKSEMMDVCGVCIEHDVTSHRLIQWTPRRLLFNLPFSSSTFPESVHGFLSTYVDLV